MGQVTQTLTWKTKVGDVNPQKTMASRKYAIVITQVTKYCMNGARTSMIQQDGAAPGRRLPILATRGQAFVS